MEVKLNRLANRIKMNEKFLKEHPENKDMLEKNIKETRELIVQYVVENCAD